MTRRKHLEPLWKPVKSTRASSAEQRGVFRNTGIYSLALSPPPPPPQLPRQQEPECRYHGTDIDFVGRSLRHGGSRNRSCLCGHAKHRPQLTEERGCWLRVDVHAVCLTRQSAPAVCEFGCFASSQIGKCQRKLTQHRLGSRFPSPVSALLLLPLLWC